MQDGVSGTAIGANGAWHDSTTEARRRSAGRASPLTSISK
jgi:hypothetical protein